jgi:hypothetical protein
MSRPWRDVLTANDPGNLEVVGAWLARGERSRQLTAGVRPPRQRSGFPVR